MPRKSHSSRRKVTLLLTVALSIISVVSFKSLRRPTTINEVQTGQTLGAFTDLANSTWAEPSIDLLYQLGITGGCSTNPLKYCPSDQVTRDQIAVFLLKSKYGGKYTPPTMSNNRYSDVPPTHWAVTWIEQLSLEGIVGGCATGKYCPSDAVTRAQVAVMLLRAKNGGSYIPPSAKGVFSDVPTSHWAANWIEALANAGITSGCSTNPAKYCPDNTITRAELAVLLVKTFNLSISTPSPSPSPTPSSTAWPTIIPSPSPTIYPSPSPSPVLDTLSTFNLSEPCGISSYRNISYTCSNNKRGAISTGCENGMSYLKKAIATCRNTGVSTK